MRRTKAQWVLLGLATVWLGYFCVVAFAQRDQLNRIDTQVQALDQQQRTLALNLENRLTKLETQLAMQSNVLWGVAGCLAALVAETGASLILRKRKEG
jgi:hypothetical protein